ncbi:2055_t:CDS:2 [Acaulospora colombiana]|uniref:2055_t:CDS:1 n=1 Tax=Acaulospora colombiana TaxID=27376 RepID=A0ACA9LBM1_9GLOM|nr:2055_t:CDS:2 [Acaulospora colombiana]
MSWWITFRITIIDLEKIDLSNSVVDQQNNVDTKTMEGVPKVSDKEIDDFIPEESMPKMTPVTLSQPHQRYPKSLEEKEIDSFLNSENKKMFTIKIGKKENLCWYCFYKTYEDQVEDYKAMKNVDEQSARTLVYNEIKLLFPDITDVKLHTIYRDGDR